MAKGRIEVNDLYCKGCGLCVTVCPKKVIAMDGERLTPKGYHPAALADPEGACTGCAICAVICPDAAITVYRQAPARERAGVAA
jgi:2-oxoglutarate ferredoxin oxidoreductase subunit delta